jgi:hypothetical protein
MFLRFLAVYGHWSPNLIAAVPGIAEWKLASLPRYLVADDIERLIAVWVVRGQGSWVVRGQSKNCLYGDCSINTGFFLKQKTVYRVRALKILKGCVALDMLRDSQAEGRLQTLKVLHSDRAQRG